MKPIFKQISIWASAFVVSAGVAFASFFDYGALNQNGNSNNNTGNNNGGQVVTPSITPQQTLLNSLISLSKAKINGNVEVLKDSLNLNLGLSGNLLVDTMNLDNIRFEGDTTVKVNGLNASGSLSYYNKKIYLDYENAKLSLQTDSILDFTEMIPNYGVDVSLPSELTDLSLNDVLNEINTMTPEKVPTGYLFRLKLNEDIDLYVKSDDEYNFTGVKTNKFYFNDTYINLDFDVDTDVTENFNFTEIDPTDYQDFAPAFDLVNVIYNTFSKANNTLNLNVSISNYNNPYLDLNADLSYDSSLSSLSLVGSILEENYDRTHKFTLGMQEDNLVVNYNNLKFKVANQSIGAVLNYVINKVGDKYLNDALGSLTGVMSNNNVGDLLGDLSNVNNLVKDIKVSENSVDVTLNLDVLGIDAGNIVISLDFDKTSFKGIAINDLNIGGYDVDINLTTKEYSPVHFNLEEYTAIDPAFSLIDSLEALSQENRFRLEFSGEVDDKNGETQNITLDGGLQFDLANKFGFGDLALTDNTGYKHDIRVDMRSYEEILFSYNQTMNGYFTSNFFTDVIGMASEILNNKDDHFYEIMDDLFGSMGSLPIMDAINEKDYGKLFEIGLIDSFNVTDESITLGLKGGLVGIDSTLTLVLNYDPYADDATTIIKSLEVKDFEYGGNTYNFAVNLKKFDDSLENQRLDPADCTTSFDSIAVLLRLGINTAVYNHYHFSGSVNANIFGLIDLTKIPIDVKILNEKGNVSIAIEFSSLPILPVVNPGLGRGSKDRKASIYYKDGYFYIHREETYMKRIIQGYNRKYEVYSKADSSYFFANIANYLCKDVLGFSDTIMNQIIGSGSNEDTTTTDSTIHYENLLSDYSYNENSEKPFFNVSLNMAELTKMSMFSDLALKVYVNDETKTLSGLSVGLDINVLVTISLSATLDLVNLGEEFTLDDMNAYINNHSSDEINKTYTLETTID